MLDDLYNKLCNIFDTTQQVILYAISLNFVVLFVYTLLDTILSAILLNQNYSLAFFAFLIALIIVLICLVIFGIRKITSKEILYIDNVAIISTLNYVIVRRAREENEWNTINISNLHATYKLDEPLGQNNGYKESFIYQIRGSDSSLNRKDNMMIYQTSPLCMSFSNIKYSYVDEITGRSWNLSSEVQKPPTLAKIKIPLPPANTPHPIRDVNITFRREKITPNENFDGYFYILDPKNFSRTVHKLTLEIHVYNQGYDGNPSDSILLMGWMDPTKRWR